MIKANNTIKVYFSPYLKSLKCWNNIEKALQCNNVSFGFLSNTKDYWVRDFMPIVVEPDRFVFYKYDPDYLQKEQNYITREVRLCYDFSNAGCIDLPLVIDGGNIIRCGDKVIMTEKVFDENPTLSHNDISQQIENALQAELVIIPWDKEDKCGHADGMVRYVGKDHVVINAYKDYNLSLQKKMIEVLSPHFNTIDELEYGKLNRKLSWAHINFLQVGKCVFVPLVNKPSDSIAIKQLQDIFGNDYNVQGIEVENIAKQGGALNCVSWHVMQCV